MEKNVPNRLTMFRIILIPIFMLVLAVDWPWGDVYVFDQLIPVRQVVAALIFIVASITDWLDGYIARRDHIVTNFGKFADPLADKMLTLTAFVFLVELGKAPAWVVSIILCRELAVTGLRLLIVENNGKVLAAQWSGKIKTASQMIAIIFLLLNNIGFQELGIPFDKIMLGVALFFTVYSGCEYFIQNKSVFYEKPKESSEEKSEDK